MMGEGEGAGPVTVFLGAGVAGDAAPHVPFAVLDAGFLARIAPERIVCALFAADCDAMMVAERLSELGWRGDLVVLAPGLPNRRMVQQELQAAAPWMRVSVIASL